MHLKIYGRKLTANNHGMKTRMYGYMNLNKLKKQLNFKDMFDEKYTDIMIDIETVDTKPSAGILSVSAVPFDIESGRTYHLPYYDMLDIHKQIDCGRSMSLDTMLWWTKQNEKARKEAFSGFKKLHHSLADLR